MSDCTIVRYAGYPSALYDELFAGWHRVEFAGRSDTANRTGASIRRVEVVWSNRPLTSEPEMFAGVA